MHGFVFPHDFLNISLNISFKYCRIVVKNLPASAGDVIGMSLISGWGRYPGGGNGNPLQYSCMENPMDRGALQATVHRVAKSQT